MTRRTGFRTADGVVPVVDITSLPEWPGGNIGDSPAVDPAYLQVVDRERISAAKPESDPGQPGVFYDDA